MVARKVEYNLATGAVSGSDSFFGPLMVIFRNLVRHMDNPKPYFEKVKADFYRTNKQVIFSQYGGNNPYADLADSTKKRKAPKPYPILVQSGRLQDSLTNPNHPESIAKILPRSLTLGSNVPYARIHQKGSPTMPKRPPIRIGNERLGRWIRMAEYYIDKAVEEA